VVGVVVAGRPVLELLERVSLVAGELLDLFVAQGDGCDVAEGVPGDVLGDVGPAGAGGEVGGPGFDGIGMGGVVVGEGRWEGEGRMCEGVNV